MEMRPEAKIQPKRWQMTGKKNKLLHATIEGYIFLRKVFFKVFVFLSVQKNDDGIFFAPISTPVSNLAGFKSNLEEEDSAMNPNVTYPKVDVEVVYPNALTTQEVG